MAGVVFKLPAWLFVVFLLTGICIVPFTFELFSEFSLILTVAFPNTLNFSKIVVLFSVLLLCIGRPPRPGGNRSNAGSCTSHSLHFCTPVGGVYTSPPAPGVKRGSHYVIGGIYFRTAYFATFLSLHAAKKHTLQSVLLSLQAESPLITCLIFSYSSSLAERGGSQGF